MDRIINYLFSFLLIGIFVFGSAEEHRQIILGSIFSVVFCFTAYLSGALSLDGMAAATIAGIYIFGLGGIPAAVVLLLFFLSGSLISTSAETDRDHVLYRVRRSGLQVWANSFWFVLFIALASIGYTQVFIIGALGALATAMADTWATELGSKRFNYSTFLLTTLKEVKAGTDGGVSLPGFIAASVAALLFSVTAVFVFSFELPLLIGIFVAGFSGCLVDSYLGAVYQRISKKFRVPLGANNPRILIDNNVVNLLSTGAGSIIAIIFKLLLL